MQVSAVGSRPVRQAGGHARAVDQNGHEVTIHTIPRTMARNPDASMSRLTQIGLLCRVSIPSRKANPDIAPTEATR